MLLENFIAFGVVLSAAWFIWSLIQQKPPSPPPAPRGSDSKKNQQPPTVLHISDPRLLINGVWRGGRRYPK